MKNLLFSILILSAVTPLFASTQQLKLPQIFGSDMVLQRNKPIKLWGWAESDSEVVIELADQKVTTRAGEDGKWKTELKAMPAGGPYSLSFTTPDCEVVLEKVMVGEVWLCSGQSNMEWPLHRNVANSKEAIKNAAIPNLRLFHLQRHNAATPADDCVGKWQVSSPKSAANFSATAFFFGRKLTKDLEGISIGLIMTAWGGTRAESWTSADGLAKIKGFKASGKYAKVKTRVPNTALYNGMIAPIVPLSIRGAIWYQGESNAPNPELYSRVFPNMVQNWRDKFQQGDFPFYYVQIAPFHYPKGKNGVGIREVQRECLDIIPNSGMVCIMDKATLRNIHPPLKTEVGERLALWALAKDYGKKVVYSGPLYQMHKVEANKIRIFFKYAESGLVGKNLKQFEISGEDGVFVPAKAVIQGLTVVVSSDKISKPKHVRYCWKNAVHGELSSKSNLPASSFKTN